jgi:hypothetical protein
MNFLDDRKIAGAVLNSTSSCRIGSYTATGQVIRNVATYMYERFIMNFIHLLVKILIQQRSTENIPIESKKAVFSDSFNIPRV